MILLSEALAMLFVYDLVRLLLPFRRLHGVVKSWPVLERDRAKGTVDEICRAVNLACVWYPKQALCLQRSFATTYLLRRRGIAAEMVLGAQKLPFKAHAWVEVGRQAVNERSNVQSAFAVWERL